MTGSSAMSAKEGTLYEPAHWADGFRELVHEMSALARLKQEKIIFGVHSGKFAFLTSKASPNASPKSILIRRYNDSILGYTTETPWGDPATDQQAAVVQTPSGSLFLEDHGGLVTPRDFAAKLVSLIAT